MATSGASLALAGGTAAAQAYLSHQAAKDRNRSIDMSMGSARRSAAFSEAKLREDAKLRKQRGSDELAQILGHIRVGAADAGVGFGGSTQALARQAMIDAERNAEIIDTNEAAGVTSVRSGLEAQLISLASGTQSPFWAALQGGLGGAQTGLAIAGGIRQLESEESRMDRVSEED